MKKIINLLVDNMALLVVVAGAIGACRPELLSWVAPHVSLMLGIVMFGMGMTLQAGDFRHVLAHPHEVAIGTGAQFLIMPLAAYGLAKVFNLPPELAVGVILVGTSPGGTASNVISYLAKGDVALSVSLTMMSTILAPFLTPLLTWILAGAWIEVSLSAMMLSIAQMVLLPLVLGLVLKHFAGRAVSRVEPILPLVSVVTIVLLVGGIVSISAERLLEVGPLMLLVVALHNALGLGLGYALAYAARLDSKRCRTISIEVGMQNSGLAASLSVLYFEPVAAIPAAIFSVWHNISGSLLANFWSRTQAKKTSRAEAVRLKA